MRMTTTEGNTTTTSSIPTSSFISVARPILRALTQYIDSLNETTLTDTSIATLADDNYVVTWQRENIDGDLNIYARRYNIYGLSLDNEFKVNTFTPFNQSAPVVSAFNGSGFVIAWQSAQQDGDDDGVYAQLFDSSASGLGEFKVNTYTTGAQRSPSIARFNDGQFIIAWQSFGQDGDNYGVYAQRYDIDGEPIGSEFGVNTYTAGPQENPSIDTFNDGGFLMAWQSYQQDGDGYGIYARYFASDGSPGDEFRISTDTASWQITPSIATAFWDDSFIITWQSNAPEGSAISAQRYRTNGLAVSSEFKVNSYMTNHSQHPRITFLNDGSFVIVWRNNGQDDESGVYARFYDANGISWDSEFLVNINPTNGSGIPSIAASNYLGFAVAWQDYSQDISDRVFISPYWVSPPDPTTSEPTTTVPPTSTTPSISPTPTITPTPTLTPTITPALSRDAGDNLAPLIAGLICGGFGMLVLLALICYCLKKRQSRLNPARVAPQVIIPLATPAPVQEAEALELTDGGLFLTPQPEEKKEVKKPKRIKHEVVPTHFFPTPYVPNEDKNPQTNPAVNPAQLVIKG